MPIGLARRCPGGRRASARSALSAARWNWSLAPPGRWSLSNSSRGSLASTTCSRYAHDHGVLHRDLKPSNVLIDHAGQPRIIDFGLAKRLHSDPQLSAINDPLTRTGHVLGSPNFIPPEQAAGKRGAIGRHSDIYSLGALLYHLLTARPPFAAATTHEIVHQVLNTEPVSPRSLHPSVPRDLETICLKCLENDPRPRYP